MNSLSILLALPVLLMLTTACATQAASQQVLTPSPEALEKQRLMAVASMFEHDPVPGGIAIVALGLSEQPMPVVQFNGRSLAIIDDGEQWQALVGIALGTKPGTYPLAVQQAGTQTRTLSYVVEAREYPEQRLVIKNKRKVNPAPLDMERITRENVRLKVVKSTRSDAPLASTFQWPVSGPISSPFGLRRFFNDQPRRPHGGIDIAAPEGTDILAPAGGIVLETGDYFFNGNCVFIDHGLGLQTFYAHMSRIDVQPGDSVAAGEVIGAVGETGRVTGPHLHWSVGLNGTWVNPLLLLDTDQPE